MIKWWYSKCNYERRVRNRIVVMGALKMQDMKMQDMKLQDMQRQTKRKLAQKRQTSESK